MPGTNLAGVGAQSKQIAMQFDQLEQIQHFCRQLLFTSEFLNSLWRILSPLISGSWRIVPDDFLPVLVVPTDDDVLNNRSVR